MSRPLRILPGDRFGLLTVLHSAPSTGNGARYTCRCDCGGTITTHGFSLRNGATTSCGCKRGTHFRASTAWTPEEDELLRARYPGGGVAAVIAAGVNRTPAAVRGRAALLNVHAGTVGRNPNPRPQGGALQDDSETPTDWNLVLSRMPPALARQTLASLDRHRTQNGREPWRPT